MAKTKTRVTPSLLADAKALAGKGYSNIILADALGISASTCTNNKLLKIAIKEGRSVAKQKVIDDLMSRSEVDQSATSSIYLSKVMRVFDDPFPTATPKSPLDALKKISDIYVAVARNQLSEDRGNNLVGYLEKYLKAFEISQVEDRLTEVERLLHEQKK